MLGGYSMAEWRALHQKIKLGCWRFVHRWRLICRRQSKEKRCSCKIYDIISSSTNAVFSGMLIIIIGMLLVPDYQSRGCGPK